MHLTRADIVELVEPLVDRTLDVCREVLLAKGLEPKDIDEVLLVGGQSRMPLVHEKVAAFFRKQPSHAVHPDEAVALGAALLAHSLGSAQGVVLIDVPERTPAGAAPCEGAAPSAGGVAALLRRLFRKAEVR
jgi:molecular chaperone DnaK